MPLGLYNGGFVGLAQLLRTLLMELTGWDILYTYDISGVIYFIINISSLLLEFQKLENFLSKQTKHIEGDLLEWIWWIYRSIL